jgi:phosphoesterase RecJ-like protein
MEMSIPIIERLKREEKDILIFTHENPDCDGIGSMIALYLFLKKLGKNVTMAMKDDFPFVCDFMPEVNEIKKLPINHKFSVAILVDASSKNRAGVEIYADEIIRIDHHIGGEFESIYDIVDDFSPSTTAVMTYVLRNWDQNLIDEKIATALYAGLITDTGSFRYNNTTDKTFEIAEFLVKKGANPHHISKMLFERNKVNVLKLLTETLSTLELYHNDQIAVLTVFRDFLNETNTREEDTEGFVNFARSIDTVKVAVLMIQREDLKTWRISIRGKGEVDVQKIARKFGGGGHKDASGCRVVGNYEDVKSKLVEAIAERIDNLEKIQVLQEIV